MASDDDIYDVYSSDEEDEPYSNVHEDDGDLDMYDVYSSNEDETYSNVHEDDGDLNTEDNNDEPYLPKNYKVLTFEDRGGRQQKYISEISNIFSISENCARTLLSHFKWDLNKASDDWFADEQSVRRSAGLLETPVDEPKLKRKTACGICFDLYETDKIVATPCHHPFCYICWTKYISVAIDDGRGCLSLRCPTPKCPVAVGADMINMLSSDGDKDKYFKYFHESYVDDNYKKNIKWCPGPGCDNAIEYDRQDERSSYDVHCLCSYQFCWNCGEDAHSPVACDIVTKWLIKNRDESENTIWMVANTKPCPRCKRAIEKNQGCNHMTCKAPCRFEFCWVCLGDWSKHSGSYSCNHYSGKTKEEDNREMAKKFIERYPHYYVRWKTNEESRKQALEDLKKSKENCEKKQGNEWKVPSGDLKFIEEAWLQVAECRRVLKWTYAYGYYIPTKEVAKIEFFEYLQGEAEAGLERLHHCVETELNNYIGFAKNPNDQEFYDFRRNLVHLTRVTDNYFDNLVKALENGLSEVNL